MRRRIEHQDILHSEEDVELKQQKNKILGGRNERMNECKKRHVLWLNIKWGENYN